MTAEEFYNKNDWSENFFDHDISLIVQRDFVLTFAEAYAGHESKEAREYWQIADNERLALQKQVKELKERLAEAESYIDEMEGNHHYLNNKH